MSGPTLISNHNDCSMSNDGSRMSAHRALMSLLLTTRLPLAMRLALLLASLPASEALPGTTNRAGVRSIPPLSSPRHLQEGKQPNPYVCTDGVKSSAEKWKVTGTNLGGWLVLEPWITPSLFYQFLGMDTKWGGRAASYTAMDMYTFCEVLGPTVANKQLRAHWAAWVREEDIKAIVATGATHVRIPVGDWQYVPYGPYIGCTDGANEELDRVLALCRKVRHG